MVLTIYIENTIVTFGVFDDDRLCYAASIAAQPNASEYEYAGSLKQILSLQATPLSEIDGAMIASVVPMLTQKLKQAVFLLLGIEAGIVGAGVKTGLNLKVSTATLGADFVCAAVCAVAEYTAPCVIVSMGTATTFSAIDPRGVFCGTAITAGVGVCLQALHQSAAQLPQISMEAPASVIGTNTVFSMQSGLVYGTAAMVDGMCRKYEIQLGQSPCFLATGQYADVIVPHCETRFVKDPYLVLKGLYRIYQKNHTNK